MSLPVAILSGGMATRLRPMTEKIPKALVEVAGKPFIEHQLNLLRRNGLTRIVLCLGYLGEMVESFLGEGKRLGVNVRYVYDGPALLGTGGAIFKALPLLGERFLVLYGDSYLDCDYRAVEKAFIDSPKTGLMTVFRNANQWDRSNVRFSGGKILEYDKKKNDSKMEYIDYGLGAFHARAFAEYSAGQAFDLADLYRKLLAQGELAGYEVKQRFYEIGSPAGLKETGDYLSKEQFK